MIASLFVSFDGDSLTEEPEEGRGEKSSSSSVRRIFQAALPLEPGPTQPSAAAVGGQSFRRAFQHRRHIRVGAAPIVRDGQQE